MFGYNMAAAHLGIAHEIVRDLQVRDVDGSRTAEANKNKASLHMGRAWFPKDHPAAKQWIHTEGKPFRHFGDQVWCGLMSFFVLTLMFFDRQMQLHGINN